MYLDVGLDFFLWMLGCRQTDRTHTSHTSKTTLPHTRNKYSFQSIYQFLISSHTTVLTSLKIQLSITLVHNRLDAKTKMNQAAIDRKRKLQVMACLMPIRNRICSHVNVMTVNMLVLLSSRKFAKGPARKPTIPHQTMLMQRSPRRRLYR